MLFALLSRTSRISNANLLRLVKPSELAAADCARAWGLEPAAVVIEDKLSQGATACLFVADDTDAGAVAAHFPGGTVRIHVDRAVDLLNGDDGVENALTHELCEAVPDPDCDQWRAHPARPGVEIALEVCDPLQDSYQVTPTRSDNGPSYVVDVANFVYPSWFESDGQAPYDHAGRFTAPGQVGPNGYVILRSKDDPSNQWLEGPDGTFPSLTHAQLQKLIHPLGRTHRRLGLGKGGKLKGPSR